MSEQGAALMGELAEEAEARGKAEAELAARCDALEAELQAQAQGLAARVDEQQRQARQKGP